MHRQLEFLDGIVFANGTMAHTPHELAVLLRDKPELKDEILQLFHDGTLEKWLQSAGWEEPAQRIAQLKSDKGSAVTILVQLNKILAQGSARYGTHSQTPETNRTIPVNNTSSPTRPPSQLLYRQQTAIRSFWRLEEERRKKEQELREKYRSKEQAINTGAAAEQERVRNRLKEIRRAWENIKQKASGLAVNLAENTIVPEGLTETGDPGQAFDQSIDEAIKYQERINSYFGEIDRTRKAAAEEEEKKRREAAEEARRRQQEEKERRKAYIKRFLLATRILSFLIIVTIILRAWAEGSHFLPLIWGACLLFFVWFFDIASHKEYFSIDQVTEDHFSLFQLYEVLQRIVSPLITHMLWGHPGWTVFLTGGFLFLLVFVFELKFRENQREAA